MMGVVDMYNGRRKSFGLDTIITNVVKGLGEAIINEAFGYSNKRNSNASEYKDAIDMQKDDDGCWEMINNE